jgi:hypothetical protein
MTSQNKLDQGKELASQLLDYKLIQLQSLTEAEKTRLQQTCPGINEFEFDDILRQVIEAKTSQQEKVGWQIIPHDLAVILITALAWICNDLRIAVIAGVAVLVLLENLFQRYFNSRLYRPLSILVWLTYPSYLVFAYFLYRIPLPWYGIIIGTICLWGGTLLLGILSRIPTQLFLQARQETVIKEHKE